MNSVGERLRQARLARGLTQEQLARGVATKGFISQVECNRATPSLAKLRLIAQRLGLPLGHLTGDYSPLEFTYLRKSAELALKAREPSQALAVLDEAQALARTANERADLERIRGMALDALGRLPAALVAYAQTGQATRDTAAAASRLLLDESWSGVDEVPLLGAEDLSFNDMAEIISDVIGKQVHFQQITFEAFKAAL